MLQRDYIMRLLQEFVEALELFLKGDVTKQTAEIQSMYDRYVGPYAFYHHASLDDVMKAIGDFPENERLQRVEMLAELYYVEAGLTVGPMRTLLLDKALAMFSFVDRHDRTYDMTRLQKMADIKRQLAKA